MKLNIFLLSLLLLTIVWADCPTLFSEKVKVQVLDGMNRVLPNAHVELKYQKDYTTGQGYVVAEGTTDQDGIVELQIVNIEHNPDRVDCTYTVTAEYNGITNTIKSYYGANQPIQVKLEVYQLIIKFLDINGKTIDGIDVKVNGYEGIKRSDGSYLFLTSGKVKITANILGKEKTYYETIEQDKYVNYVIDDIVKMKISVIDDQNNLLEGTIILDNYSYNINGTEYISTIKDLTNFTVRYKNMEKLVKVDLDKNRDYQVLFDTHSPTITNERVELKNNTLFVYADIEDYALDSVKLTYTIGNEEKTAEYEKEKGSYKFRIDWNKEYKIIPIKISAYDKTGNSVIKEGRIVIEEQTETTEEKEGGIDPILIGGAIIAVILLIVVWKYIKGLNV